jgi:hypothetical protein
MARRGKKLKAFMITTGGRKEVIWNREESRMSGDFE